MQPINSLTERGGMATEPVAWHNQLILTANEEASSKTSGSMEEEMKNREGVSLLPLITNPLINTFFCPLS